MIKLATLFSGIGAIEQAFEKLQIEHEIKFACDNGGIELGHTFEELIDMYKSSNEECIESFVNQLYLKTGKINYVKNSYLANYAIVEDDFFYDVRFLNASKYKGNIDLLVGGSPCQSFSVNGKQLGFEDTRGTLFYEFARVIKESQPKIFIYENVPGLLSHDKGKTWETVCNVFDELNYTWNFSVLNAKDFGIAQNRRRVFVVGYRKDFMSKKFQFPTGFKLESTVKDYLEAEVDHKYFLPIKGFNYTTNPKNKKRVSVNSEISRCQAANQQFNWCGDFRFMEKEKINKMSNDTAFCGNYNGLEGYVRKLTPRECLRLMGFSDDFNIVVPDKQLYHQSGNSIVVNVLEEILKLLLIDLQKK